MLNMYFVSKGMYYDEKKFSRLALKRLKTSSRFASISSMTLLFLSFANVEFFFQLIKPFSLLFAYCQLLQGVQSIQYSTVQQVRTFVRLGSENFPNRSGQNVT